MCNKIFLVSHGPPECMVIVVMFPCTSADLGSTVRLIPDCVVMAFSLTVGSILLTKREATVVGFMSFTELVLVVRFIGLQSSVCQHKTNYIRNL